MSTAPPSLRGEAHDQIGHNKPITQTKTPNTACSNIGELSLADDDGSVLVCTEELTPQTSINKTALPHAH